MCSYMLSRCCLYEIVCVVALLCDLDTCMCIVYEHIAYTLSNEYCDIYIYIYIYIYKHSRSRLNETDLLSLFSIYV